MNEDKNERNLSMLHKQQLFTRLNVPVVFHNQVEDWPCRKWDLNHWADKFQSKKMKFRLGPIVNSTGEPLWEHDCKYVEATLREFLDRTGHFKNYPASTHWAYADYKHMAQLFPSDHPIQNCVDWSCFGLTGRKGGESTFWLGERHSHTPCHYDSYGFNLVAQLIGCKRWILFPPTAMANLYPTRIPYEESSVFSRVNTCSPNLISHPYFKNTKPVVIILKPGDCLFVPPGWWHFVKSITDHTLSINSWIEMESDDERRLEEAVTKELITDFIGAHELDRWLNPTEESTSPSTNLNYIERCLAAIKSGPGNRTTIDTCIDVEKQLDVLYGRDNYHLVNEMSFDDYLQYMKECGESHKADSAVNDEQDLKLNFLNALLHPNVIDLICQKLKS